MRVVLGVGDYPTSSAVCGARLCSSARCFGLRILRRTNSALSASAAEFDFYKWQGSEGVNILL